MSHFAVEISGIGGEETLAGLRRCHHLPFHEARH